MTRPTGHLKDSLEVVARRLGFHHHRTLGVTPAGPLPLFTVNRYKLPTSVGGPGIWNQNDASGCEGCCHSSAATLRFNIMEQPFGERLSNVGCYYGGLIVDRVPGPDGKLPPLVDQGTYPSSILTAAQTWGLSCESVWGQQPMSSQALYVTPGDPAKIMKPPSPEQLYGERACRLQGAYFTKSGGLQKVLDILRALADGRPVSMALPASGSAFQNYTSGIISWPGGQVDHANYFVDYAWLGTQDQFDAWQGGASGLDTLLVLYAVNSWSEQWGESDVPGIDGGLYRVDRSFAENCEDAAVLDFVKIAA